MRNRKWWTFLVAVVAICFLSFFEKDGSSSIVALAIGLFASNVVQKNEHFNTNNREDK